MCTWTIQGILKYDLNYSYRKAPVSYLDSNWESIQQYRKWFKAIFAYWCSKGVNWIWIDEVAFNSRRVAPYAWIEPLNPMPVFNFKMSEQTNAISAMTDEGMIMVKFRFGTNTQATFVEFLLEMERFLKKYIRTKDSSFNAFENYWSSTVLVFDNATIHRGAMVQEFCSNRGWLALTLPPYTPEFNPIELMFWSCKAKLYKRLTPSW